jgi:hypothetical protein
MGVQISDNVKPIEKNYKYEKQQSRVQEEIKTSTEKTDIRIDLPTYRPEVIKNEKVFIPIEREP